MKLWLFLPSQWIHHALPYFLYLKKLFFKTKIFNWNSFKWRGLEFKNPLGTAGGLDKSGNLTQGWWSYGPGFVELGTITPESQKANPGIVLRKNRTYQALWNYMGFPNKGVRFLIQKLKKLKNNKPTPIFISIGKNRTTPISEASQDYTLLIQQLYKYADAFIINISSPNTEHLRSLFQPQNFENFLKSILNNKPPSSPPLLLKLSPDFTDDEFLKIIEISDKQGIDGWVLCNSTLQRKHLTFPQYGGVSGKPLAPLSKHFLKLLVQYLDKNPKNKLIISTGGILSPKDVFERLSLGAHLTQVYSALVFHGPSFFKKTYQQSRNRSEIS